MRLGYALARSLAPPAGSEDRDQPDMSHGVLRDRGNRGQIHDVNLRANESVMMVLLHMTSKTRRRW